MFHSTFVNSVFWSVIKFTEGITYPKQKSLSRHVIILYNLSKTTSEVKDLCPNIIVKTECSCIKRNYISDTNLRKGPFPELKWDDTSRYLLFFFFVFILPIKSLIVVRFRVVFR